MAGDVQREEIQDGGRTPRVQYSQLFGREQLLINKGNCMTAASASEKKAVIGDNAMTEEDPNGNTDIADGSAEFRYHCSLS